VALLFDKKNLAKDVLLAISRAIDSKGFRGHDDRDYAIVHSRVGNSAPERFIDVVVTTGNEQATVATYGLVLIGISKTP
jgi:hypothetical protein